MHLVLKQASRTMKEIVQHWLRHMPIGDVEKETHKAR